jgi:hypothetical protein
MARAGARCRSPARRGGRAHGPAWAVRVAARAERKRLLRSSRHARVRTDRVWRRPVCAEESTVHGVRFVEDDPWLAELAAAKRIAVACGPRHPQEGPDLRLHRAAETQTACAQARATAPRPAPELRVASRQDDEHAAGAWSEHLALLRKLDDARVAREHQGAVEVRPRTAEEIAQLLRSTIRASSSERAMRRLAAIQRRAPRPTASPGKRRAYRPCGRRRTRSTVAAVVHSGPDGPSPGGDEPPPTRALALRHRATPIGAAQ